MHRPAQVERPVRGDAHLAELVAVEVVPSHKPAAAAIRPSEGQRREMSHRVDPRQVAPGRGWTWESLCLGCQFPTAQLRPADA